MNIRAYHAPAIQAAIAIIVVGASHSAYGFQIAPLSSEWEERLTKEPTSNRAKVAGKLGRLIKGPVLSLNRATHLLLTASSTELVD